MKYINLFDTQAAYDAAEKYYPNVSYIEATDEVVYQETDPIHDYSKDYLTFEALESGTFSLTVPANVNSTYMTSISYSIDNGSTWTTTNIDNTAQTITTPTIAQGGKVLWKGTGNQMAVYAGTTSSSQFSSTGDFNVSGNIMSLLYGDNFENQTSLPSGSEHNFHGLFNNNKLITAENLILPATTLTKACYNSLFSWCNKLTTSPLLQATTLVQECYQSMFYGSSSVNNITMLATNISATSCLTDWVKNVAANGTFTKAASMTIPTGANGIPANWTVVEIN